MQAMTPAQFPRRSIAVETRTHVEKASLCGGVTIAGQWYRFPELYHPDNPVELLQDFANWPTDPESILRFTLKFGPLTPAFAGGKMFSFKLEDWRRLQADFKTRWEAEMLLPGKPVSFAPGFLFDAEHGEGFRSLFGDLYFRTNNFYRLLTLELHLQNADRLRKCQRPDCPHPYFLAKRLRQRYCSEPCVRWAQRQWNLDWWNKHGSEIRSRKAGKGKKKSKERT